MNFIGSLPESFTQGLLIGKLLIGGLGVVPPLNQTLEDLQDSSQGGALETGCSELYDVLYCFIMQYYPHPLNPPPTAPPCNEYPDLGRGFLGRRVGCVSWMRAYLIGIFSGPLPLIVSLYILI